MQSHGTTSHRLVGNMRSGPEHRACAPPLATPAVRQRAGTGGWNALHASYRRRTVQAESRRVTKTLRTSSQGPSACCEPTIGHTEYEPTTSSEKTET